MKNCFEGYLTDACKDCGFWHDGTGDSIGCGAPFPIDHCDDFRKEYEKNNKIQSQQQSKSK